MRWLHPALWTLLLLRGRGSARRYLRELRSPRRAVVFLLGFSLVWLTVRTLLQAGPLTVLVSPERLGELYRSGLLTLVLVGQIKTLGDRAVNFAPSEVDFLFAGPFVRRELLVYRVLFALGGILLMSAVLTILLSVFGAWWPAAFVGVALSLLLLHQIEMCLATLRETLEAHAYTWVRRVVVLSLVGMVVVSLAYAFSLQSRLGTLDVLNAAYATWTMQALLLPFVPFAEVVTAPGFDLAVVGWVAVCLLINAGVFLLLVRLDAGNLELSAALNRRDLLQARGPGSRRMRARSVPILSPLWVLPHLKGVGTLASLQLTQAMRGYRLLGELALFVLVIAGVFHFSQGGAGGSGAVHLGHLANVTIWATILVSNPLRFDFRGGPRNLDYLKTLPIPAWALCTGQLVTPVVITLLYQAPFLALAAPSLTPGALITAVAVAIPLNILWYGLENLGFLLAPASQSSRGIGDIQYLGRQLFMLSVKVAVMVVGALLAVGLVIVLSKIFVLNSVLLIGVILWVLFTEVMILIGVLAFVFKRFDPSRAETQAA